MPADRVRFDEFEFDLRTLELWKHGTPVPLPPKPSKALQLLLARNGSLVTREELHEHVWAGTIVELDQALNTCIRQLRATLGDAAGGPRFIDTVPRRGYRMIPEIRPVLPHPPDERPPPRSIPTRRVMVAATTVAVVLVAAVGTIAYTTRPGRVAQPVRVAILPLQSLSETETNRLFADGLSEELITTLAGLAPDRFAVIARTSAASVARRDLAASEIGSLLDVDFVVEGSIRPRDAHQRITLRLIRTSDESTVWSQRYDHPVDAPVSTQELLATQLATAMIPTLGETLTPNRRLAPVPAARVAWLMARHLLNREDSAGASGALPLLDTVIVTDPDFVLAHVAYGQALLRLNRNDEVEEAIRPALESAPDFPEALFVRGQLRLRQWRLDEAGPDLARAAARASSDSRVHDYYAYYLSVTGRHADARREILLAAAIDPVSSAIFSDAGTFAFWAGNAERAAADCEQSLAVSTGTRRLGAHRCLLLAYEQLGDAERARLHANEILTAAGASPDVRASVARAPNPTVGLRRYKEWATVPANLEYSQGVRSPYAKARALAMAGDVAGALAALEDAVAGREPSLIQIAVDPRLDPLRGDRRFEEIVSAVLDPRDRTEDRSD